MFPPQCSRLLPLFLLQNRKKEKLRRISYNNQRLKIINQLNSPQSLPQLSPKCLLRPRAHQVQWRPKTTSSQMSPPSLNHNLPRQSRYPIASLLILLLANLKLNQSTTKIVSLPTTRRWKIFPLKMKARPWPSKISFRSLTMTMMMRGGQVALRCPDLVKGSWALLKTSLIAFLMRISNLLRKSSKYCLTPPKLKKMPPVVLLSLLKLDKREPWDTKRNKTWKINRSSWRQSTTLMSMSSNWQMSLLNR